MKQEFPNIESCNPTECISNRLRKCNRIIDELFRKYVLPFGVTNSQLSILFVASKANIFTQNFISEKLFLEKSTVNRNTNKLIKKGYLEKLTKKEIELTHEGKKVLEKIIPEWRKAMTEAREKLSNEGEEALGLLLTKLTV